MPDPQDLSSAAAERFGNEFNLRSGGARGSSDFAANVAVNRQPGSSGSLTRRSAAKRSAEVIDLLDDDEEVQEVPSSSSARKNLDASAFSSSIPGVGDQRSRHSPLGSTEERVDVERVYLGAYGFHSDSPRKLYVRVDAGVNRCLLLGLNQDEDGKMGTEPEVVEEIPFDQIKKIMYCRLARADCEHESVVVLAVKTTLVLRCAGVGPHCMLCPTLPASTASSSKHILLMMSGVNLGVLCAQLKKVPAFSKTNMLAEQHWKTGSSLLSDVLTPHRSAMSEGFAELRAEWRVKAQTELENRQKGERRRQRSARLLGLEPVDPNDCLPYTVYPIEPEIPDAITIFHGDLKRLAPGEYLNDSLIDMKIKYLARTLLSPEQQARVHVFNCMFYTRLTADKRHEAGHALVARWTKNIDVFDRDFIVIPINYTYHWSLAVIIRPGALLATLEALQQGDLAASQSALSAVPSPSSSSKKKRRASPAAGSTAEPVVIRSPIVGETGAGNVKCLCTPDSDAEDGADGGEVDDAPEVQQEGAAADMACILHMDSLGMHGTVSIGKWLKSYLRFEWEARKRGDLDARLLGRIAEMLTGAGSGAAHMEDADGEDGAGAHAGAGSFDEAKFRKTLETHRKRLFDNIPVIKCKVPMQANGFDCGLFVTKFAEMLLRRQPGSTPADIADKFATLLPASDFSQQDVDLERVELRRLIDSIRVERDKLREAQQQQKQQQKEQEQPGEQQGERSGDSDNNCAGAVPGSALCSDAASDKDDAMDTAVDAGSTGAVQQPERTAVDGTAAGAPSDGTASAYDELFREGDTATARKSIFEVIGAHIPKREEVQREEKKHTKKRGDSDSLSGSGDSRVSSGDRKRKRKEKSADHSLQAEDPNRPSSMDNLARIFGKSEAITSEGVTSGGAADPPVDRAAPVESADKKHNLNIFAFVKLSGGSSRDTAVIAAAAEEEDIGEAVLASRSALPSTAPDAPVASAPSKKSSGKKVQYGTSAQQSGALLSDVHGHE